MIQNRIETIKTPFVGEWSIDELNKNKWGFAMPHEHEVAMRFRNVHHMCETVMQSDYRDIPFTIPGTNLEIIVFDNGSYTERRIDKA